MPSDKPKVTSYLEVTEKTVFDKFCSEQGYSNSEGVSHLIREQLIEKTGSHTAISKLLEHEDKIGLLASGVRKAGDLATATANRNEILAGIISSLRAELDELRKEILYSPKREFTDEGYSRYNGSAYRKGYSVA